jgi:hypothetical protein
MPCSGLGIGVASIFKETVIRRQERRRSVGSFLLRAGCLLEVWEEEEKDSSLFNETVKKERKIESRVTLSHCKLDGMLGTGSTRIVHFYRDCNNKTFHDGWRDTPAIPLKNFFPMIYVDLIFC